MGKGIGILYVFFQSHTWLLRNKLLHKIGKYVLYPKEYEEFPWDITW